MARPFRRTGVLHISLWAVACLIFFSTALSARAQNQPTLPTAERLQHVLETLRTDLQLPSLRAAIRNAHGAVDAACGLADIENGIALDTSIGMPGGSTGKSFVAATTMLLVEYEVLDLDDPISLYVAEQRWFKALPDANKITVRHLLSHTSGMTDHVADIDFGLSVLWRRLTGGLMRYQPAELIDMVVDDGLLFEPGTGYNYTDSGYLALGQVIESAMSMRYYEMLDEMILEPHQLAARPQISAHMENVSVGYVDSSLLMSIAGWSGRNMEDGVMVLDPSTEWTGGGLVTTPAVLAAFYHKLSNGEIVSPESYQLMIQAGHRDPQQPSHYGLGLFVSESSIGHGGWFPGYRTDARHFPWENLTIAVQTNTDAEFPMSQITKALYELVMETSP